MKFFQAIAILSAATFRSGKVSAELLRKFGKIRGAEKTRQRKLSYPPPLEYVGESEDGDPHLHLDVCQGDCDSDSDCQSGLHCFKREPRTTNEVPYCGDGRKDNPGKDYCTDRWVDEGHLLWLLKVGDNGVREDNDSPMTIYQNNDQRLKMCEGDCDNDDQCALGLYCFQRGQGVPNVGKNADIPGCWNVGGDPGQDYCTAYFEESPHIVAADLEGPNLLMINDGTGTFGNITLPGGSRATESVAVHDMNGDGLLDIIFGNYGTPNQLLINDGNYGFEVQELPDLAQYSSDGGTYLRGVEVAVGYINNDDLPDIVVANWKKQNQVLINAGISTTGGVSFTPHDLPSFKAGEQSTSSVAVADLNGDGFDDILIGHYDNQESYIMMNKGDLTFQFQPLPGLPGVSEPRDVSSFAVADVNDDAAVDIVVGYRNNKNQVLFNDPNVAGTFTSQELLGSLTDHEDIYWSDLQGGNPTTSVAVGDLVNNSLPDIIVGNTIIDTGVNGKVNATNQLHANDPTNPGNFSNSTFLPDLGSWRTNTESIIVADFNHDGFNDVVLGNKCAWSKILFGDGTGFVDHVQFQFKDYKPIFWYWTTDSGYIHPTHVFCTRLALFDQSIGGT